MGKPQTIEMLQQTKEDWSVSTVENDTNEDQSTAQRSGEYAQDAMEEIILHRYIKVEL